MTIPIEAILERNPVDRLSGLLFSPNGMANDHLKSISDRIARCLKDWGLASQVIGIYLVGSHVKGNFSENSDVDVRLHVQDMSYTTQRELEVLLIMHLNE